MKKSEFLNKTVEELNEILNDLISIPGSETDTEQLEFAKMLITDKALLKATTMTREDRYELLSLVETLRALSAFAKETDQESVSGITIFTLSKEAMQKAERRSEELEKDFEDDLDEDFEQSMYEAAEKLLKVSSENPDKLAKTVGEDESLYKLMNMLDDEDEGYLN